LDWEKGQDGDLFDFCDFVIAWVGGKGQDWDLFDFCDFVIAWVIEIEK
jgi:hypothetical protein